MKKYAYLAVLVMGSWLALLFNSAAGNEQSLNKWTVTGSMGSRSIAYAQELRAGMVDPETGKKIKYWVAPMDPKYIRYEPGKSPMGMDLVPVYEEEGEEKEPASTIRIDPVTRQNMGLRLGKVERKPITRSIRTFGNVTYDETTLFAVNTKFNGWVEKLHVDFVGDHVEKGQPLFEIYSPELFAAQQEFLLALKQENGISHKTPGTVRKSNQRMLEAARTRLKYWDLNDAQIEEIKSSGKIKKNLTIYSPARGVVTKKNVFEGHYVKAGIHQYEIADLSTVWVDVDIYEYELPWVRKGMPAEMDLAYIPGERFQGEVLFIYPYVDPKTRTGKLRLTFDNPGFKLKPGMYANVYLKSTLNGNHIVIPQEAVIDSGVRKIVFVSKGKGRFEPREVNIGVEGNNYLVQVLDGLQAGDQIVISGQFMLDSESRLQEAIQKMLAAKGNTREESSADDPDLNMDDMTMDETSKSDVLNMDDLSMDDLTMDEKSQIKKNKPQSQW